MIVLGATKLGSKACFNHSGKETATANNLPVVCYN